MIICDIWLLQLSDQIYGKAQCLLESGYDIVRDVVKDMNIIIKMI